MAEPTLSRVNASRPRLVRNFLGLSASAWPTRKCVFRSIVTDRFGIVTGEFGNVTDCFGDVTDGVLKTA